MRKRKNLAIRNRILSNGLYYYTVANYMNVSPTKLSLMLQSDLSPAEKDEINTAILSAIAAKKTKNGGA